MKAMKILLYTRTCFIFPRNVTTFSSVSNINPAKLKKNNCRMTALHRVRWEDRFMYGPMTKQKEKQTLQKLANSSQNRDTLMDSELWWTLKLARYTKKSHIRVKPILVPKAKENIVRSDKDTKEVEIMCKRNDIEDKHNNASKARDIANEPNSSSFKDPKLLGVVINNISTFPIFNVVKKLPLVTDKVKILSISSRDDPDTLHYPSVTKILSATLSEESRKALELWKAKLIAEMGADKFNEYYQEQLKNGALFHSCIENTLQGKSVDIPDHIEPAFNSLSNIVKELKDIRVIESHVSHKHLYYKGKIDCVAVYRGELCVIDWKKSEKSKSSLSLTYDAPIQIAAYIGALNYSKSYPFTVNSGLIVVGYTNGKPADTYVVQKNVLKMYWKKWLAKLQQYWSSISKTD